MSLRYRFYNRYPATETNETCLWHRVNHPVPMTSFSTGWNTNRYQGPLRRSLASSPVPCILSPFPQNTELFIDPQIIELTNTEYSQYS